MTQSPASRPQLIFICSPFRETCFSSPHLNIGYAKALCLATFAEGNYPFAPHLLYPSFLNDENPLHRHRGMEAGKEILAACDALYVGLRYSLSIGMRMEIDYALALSIPIYSVDLDDKPAIIDRTPINTVADLPIILATISNLGKETA
jgi:hypothetical protein